jgi:hypothetical protein
MTRARDTRTELRRAIVRIERKRPKRISKECCRLNISMVAREAGVTPACIHNNYPDVAEAIRAKVGKTARSMVDANRVELERLAVTIRALRQRLKASERDVVRIASENARLVSENAVLKAQVGSTNVVAFQHGSS